MLVSIISLPLTINYLGSERFGMMETIIALIMMLSFADLGLGFGLQNRIAELENNQDEKKLHRAISSVFYVLVFFAMILAVFFYLLFHMVAWDKLFNVKSELAISEAPVAVLFFFVCFIIQIPFSIVRKVQVGLQEGYINEIWRSIGNIVGLGGLLLVIYWKLGVPYIILAIYGSNAIFLILNFLSQFIWKRSHLFPKWSEFDLEVFKGLYKDGLVFLGLQVSTIVLTSSDRILIAQMISAEAVTIYSVGYRLAMIFATPLDAFVSPLLPAFNDALAKQDLAWIKRILGRAFRIILIVSSTLGIFLYFGGNKIIEIWIREEDIQLSISVLLAFSAFILYTNLNTLISYIMLTPKFIDQLLKTFAIAVGVATLLKLYLIDTFNIQGAIWATIIGMSLFFFLPSLKILKTQKFI